MTTRIERIAAGSWSFPNLPKTWRVASEKQHGTESKNTCNFPIFDTFGRYIWKAIAPEASNPGTPKLELKVQMGIRTAQAHPIIPVVQKYTLLTLL